MYKIHIHKSLLKNNQDSSVNSVDIKKVSDIFLYMKNFYPEIKTDKVFLLNQEKNKFPDSWIIKDELPSNQRMCYIIPCIGGKDFTAIASGFQEALFKAAVGAAIAVGLSYAISAIMPRPKNNPNSGIGDQERIDNNVFEGLKNTIDSGSTVPLNYGMLRVAGQFITSDVDTINHTKEQYIKVSDYV